MTDFATMITAFTALFVIVDPIGLVPLFIALTTGMTAAERRVIALRACTIAAVLMCVFLFLGEAVLGFIGISMPAFRIAGGILLFLTALEMLFQRRQERKRDNADKGAEELQDDPSVFPLAIPLITGPGAITTIILLSDQADGALGYMAIMAVLCAVLSCVLIAFLLGDRIEKALGKIGINILTRVLGMLLAALAVQFILDGIKQSF
jgi:multiple antibiotic resistance protein